MGEHNFTLDSGQLYITNPDGTHSLVGHITNVECTSEDNDISVPVVSLADLEDSFEMVAKVTENVVLAITGVYHAVINCCPDKRVTHLALHAKKARTRKKNRNRAIKILKKGV